MTTMAANRHTPGGLVPLCGGPRHLVALADGAPHGLSDELRSHATRWRNQFVGPVLAASSPEAVDAVLSEVLRPFGRYLFLDLFPLVLRAMNSEGLDFQSLSAESARRMRNDLGHPPRWLDPANRDDIEWSTEVLFSLFDQAATEVPTLDLSSLFPEQALSALEADPNGVRIVRANLLLVCATEALSSPRPPASGEAFDRICELLYGDTSQLANLFAAQGVDWRKVRDVSAGSRAERIVRYGNTVLTGLSANERLTLRQARLPERLFDP